MDDKKCSKCELFFSKSDFHKNKKSSDGLVSQCKFCSKKNYVDNQDRLVSKQGIYDHNNRDKIHTRMNEYCLQNRDRIINRNKDYQLENHDRIMAQGKIYTNNRYKTDVSYRLICKTRTRIYKSLKGMTKQLSSINILGIDIDLYRK